MNLHLYLNKSHPLSHVTYNRILFHQWDHMSLEKRKHERIDMKKVYGIYAIVRDEKMIHMSMMDVSPEGCAFKIAAEHGFKRIPEELEVRLSFFEEEDLDLIFHVENVREHVVDGTKYIIYGCSINPADHSYLSYLAFINSLAPIETSVKAENQKDFLKAG